ncbi:arsenic resistance protein [Fontimonas sp. SYSU GA230001]|uniref:arsenic resistance protein n=1 Tax=Fontimonas sp. SYSU GA230001 TaxID=3142450 RepID=UPI0032B5CE4C
MTRLDLERGQVWIYLAAIAAGLLTGSALPGSAPALAALLWPALMVLLYATFVQVPLLHLRAAFADHRFVAAALTGNFVLVPLVVAALASLLPPDPALRLGVLLVLLVPCTDWFITFSQLGRGDTPRAIAVTPLNLLLQLLLLPVYLWLMGGAGVTGALTPARAAPALAIVLLPLAAAALSERWIEARPQRAAVRETLAWWPVPLLALVVFLIAGAQVAALGTALAAVPRVVPLFAAYLLLAALLARRLATLFRLPAPQGRTLAFSLGTRNSFVVLPFALTLPPGWEVAAVVIVIQSLVELFGMVAYLIWIPRRLFPDPPAGRPAG